MSPQRRISFAFGALYLITFATSISAALLFQPVLDDPQGYIAGAGTDNRIYLNRYNGTAWTGWSEVPGGGATPSAPSATVYAARCSTGRDATASTR